MLLPIIISYSIVSGYCAIYYLGYYSEKIKYNIYKQ